MLFIKISLESLQFFNFENALKYNFIYYALEYFFTLN